METPCVVPNLWEHMFVLGIDPGLTRTGYGVVASSGASIRAVAAGVIRTDPHAAIEERLAELHSDLTTVIADHAPVEAAIEQVFVNQNRRTAVSVARASGVALLAAADPGQALIELLYEHLEPAVVDAGAALRYLNRHGPFEPQLAETTLQRLLSSLPNDQHISVYLDAIRQAQTKEPT